MLSSEPARFPPKRTTNFRPVFSGRIHSDLAFRLSFVVSVQLIVCVCVCVHVHACMLVRMHPCACV